MYLFIYSFIQLDPVVSVLPDVSCFGGDVSTLKSRLLQPKMLSNGMLLREPVREEMRNARS